MRTPPEEKKRGMGSELRDGKTTNDRNSTKFNEYVRRAKTERFCDEVRKREGDATEEGGGEEGGWRCGVDHFGLSFYCSFYSSALTQASSIDIFTMVKHTILAIE